MNSLPIRVIFACLLAPVSLNAWALDVGHAASNVAGEVAGGVARDVARNGEPLAVSLDFIVPEYKAGAKFRSPATIDTAIAEDLAKRLQVPLAIVDSDKADVQLTTINDTAAIPPSVAVIPISYRAAPMAIMRTDTSIRRWEHLKDRTVCVAQGGNHVGTLAARYGAIEKIHPSPTDALVALRTGDCDAMVHDSPMLEELIRLPEWQKFSRYLPAGRRGTLAFLVPADDRKKVSLLKQVASDWRAKDYPEALVKNAVRNIAFEVYLEQDVPDCH
jgi:polar amino acid transport system substrate-binding protein